MFIPDKPNTKNDDLGRRDFARNLAKALLSYTESDCLTMAIYGTWGSGKSTVLSMLLEEIGNSLPPGTNKPIVLEFQPWHYSDQDKLISSFFSQLGKKINYIDKSKSARIAGKKLISYANFFAPLGVVASGSPLPALAQMLFQKFGSILKAKGELDSYSLEETKRQINRQLERLNRKVIVTIDDIDRLNKSEIRQIFQLVRVLGDFSNVVYILSFDKNVVCQALADVQSGDGNAYLEKIIQLPFELPISSNKSIIEILRERIEELNQSQGISDFDWIRWDEAIEAGIEHLITNIRDINRLVNYLRFCTPIVKNEVNIVDLYIISSIQLFEPELFKAIRTNRSLFTRLIPYSGLLSVSKNSNEAIIGTINAYIKPVKRITKDHTIAILQTIFPLLGTIYGDSDSVDSSFTRNWRKEKRLCTPEFFNNYFHFSPLSTDLPHQTIISLVNNIENTEILTERLRELARRDLLPDVFDRLLDHASDTRIINNPLPLILAILEVSNSHISQCNYSIINQIFYSGADLIEAILKSIPDKERRYNLLKGLVSSDRQLYYSVMIADKLFNEFEKIISMSINISDAITILLYDDILELQKHVVEQIRNKSIHDDFLHRSHVSFLLKAWKDWGDDATRVQYVHSVLNNDESTLWFIRAYFHDGIASSHDHLSQQQLESNLSHISQFISKDNLRNRLEELAQSSTLKSSLPALREAYNACRISLKMEPLEDFNPMEIPK